MKNTVATLQQQKLDGDKITMLTAYDYSTAKLVDECGVNTIWLATLWAWLCSAMRIPSPLPWRI